MMILSLSILNSRKKYIDTLFIHTSFLQHISGIVLVYIDNNMFCMFCVHFKSQLRFINALRNNNKSMYTKKVILSYTDFAIDRYFQLNG